MFCRSSSSLLLWLSLFFFFFGSNNTKTRDGHTTTVPHSSWNQGCFHCLVWFYHYYSLQHYYEDYHQDTQSASFVCVYVRVCACLCVCMCVCRTSQCSVLRACLLKGETGRSQ